MDDDEENPLLKKPSETDSNSNAANSDSSQTNKKKVKNRQDEPEKSSMWNLLLRSSTSKEVMLMVLGTCAALLQGTVFPSLSVIFGNMSDTIMGGSLPGHRNGSTAPTNNITIGTFHLKRVLIEDIETSPDFEEVDVKTSYFESYLVPKHVANESYAGSQQEFHDNLTFFSTYAIIIGLVALSTSIIQSVTFEVSSSGQNTRRSQGFYENVLHQDHEWFDKNERSKVAGKFSGYLDDVQHGAGTQISEIVQKLSAFFTGVAVALLKSWPFALVLLAVVPILTIKSAFNARFSDHSTRKSIKYGKGGMHSLQVFSAIRTVAAYGAETKEIERYRAEIKSDLQAELRHHYRMAFGYALSNFLTYAAYALAFWTAANILAAGQITAGTVYAILLALMVGASDLGNAWHHVVNLRKAQDSAGAVDEVVESTHEKGSKHSKGGLILDQIEGRIEFRNVNFKYPTSKKSQNAFALENVSFVVEPQQIIAFVGPKSSGKSTITKLLEGFYEVDGGNITIDGHSIQSLDLAKLRTHIGVIPKTPFLFNGTIKENIGCGRLGATDEEIMDAARKAFAHEFISELPQGYDTIIEDDDAYEPTKEQKQLISIARALLRDPAIIIMDEPLLNEQIYPNATQGIGSACEGRTLIITSTRVAAIEFANQIYVLNHGAVVESGSRESLMESDGLFNSLLAEELLMNNIEELSTEADLAEEEDEDQIHAKHAKGTEGQLTHPVKSEMEDEVEKFNLQPSTSMEIIQLNQPESVYMIMAAIAAIFCGAVLPIHAILYAEIFNTFMKSGDELWDAASYWTIMFLWLAGASALAHGIQIVCAAKAGETLITRLKFNAFSQIIRQSISWFEEEEHSPEKLARRLAIDAELIRGAGIDLLCNILTVSTTITLSFVIIIYSSWKIGLVVLVLAYPFILVTRFKQTVDKHLKMKMGISGRGSADQIMDNCFKNIQSVQELGLEDYFYEKYKKAKEEADAWDAFKAQMLTCTKTGFAKSGIFFVYSGVFGFGSWMISIGIIDPVSLFRIFFTTIFCATGIGSLVASIVDHSKGQLAAALVLYLSGVKSTIDPLRLSGKVPRIDGELVVTDASFNYPSKPPTLDELSFKAEKKRILALAGPPSSGKSTVFALYERFYDVTRGRILIDGYDVRDLKLQHLRHSIGLVTKSPFFFDATIRDNLTYGIGGPGEVIPEDKIIDAASFAMIHDFIMTLPQRYDTLIGPKGHSLSIRQKQRLAFARALIRNPTILLVDEPRIYNEPEESRLLAEDVLDKACAGRTCIIIARSNYILSHSDCVAFMGNGKLMEMGSPAEILATKGIEYHLKKRQ